MNKKIGHYQWFFSDQLNQMQLEQKTLLSTPIGQLVNQGVVSMGYAEKVIPEKGHIVIKFPNGYAPRLKVPKSFFVIKKAHMLSSGLISKTGSVRLMSSGRCWICIRAHLISFRSSSSHQKTDMITWNVHHLRPVIRSVKTSNRIRQKLVRTHL